MLGVRSLLVACWLLCCFQIVRFVGCGLSLLVICCARLVVECLLFVVCRLSFDVCCLRWCVVVCFCLCLFVVVFRSLFRMCIWVSLFSVVVYGL